MYRSLNRKTTSRLSDPVRKAIKPALKTAVWFVSVMVPVSFAVTLMQHWGIMAHFAYYLEPVCRMFGLRGEAALVIITAALMNLYSVVAVIQSIPFTAREICIMALMGLLAHNLIVETLVQMKTGSSGLKMVSVRLAAAAAGGMFLNWALPEDNTITMHGIASGHLPLIEVMENWLTGTIWVTLKITCIIVSLNILQRILDEFGVMAILARWVAPLMRPMGLSKNAGFLWIIAYVVGLAYGAAILIEHRNENKISARDADYLNYHIGMSHSHIEDTAIFLAIGAGLLWITLPRIVLAIITVWIVKLFQKWAS